MELRLPQFPKAEQGHESITYGDSKLTGWYDQGMTTTACDESAGERTW